MRISFRISNNYLIYLPNWEYCVKEFLDIHFDVLVGFYSEENEFLDIMVSRSKAKFKIGFEGADSRLFDLILQVNPMKFNQFKAELKKYLSVLKKI